MKIKEFAIDSLRNLIFRLKALYTYTIWEVYMHIQDYQFYKKLTQHPSVKEIWLFGSRARGDNQERADIDLALFCPNASEKEWLDILNIIDDADTLLKIDTVRLDQLSETSPLKKSISQQGKKIYEKL